MMKTGAEVVIESLQRNGTETVFSYPGGAILPVYDALGKSSIKNVLVRQEQGAVHAASGYARITGKAGVVIATSGPGATNLVTGIATANMDSVPIILITGQVSTNMIGTDAFQETDITGITHPITKHNYLVKDSDELAEVIDEAFHIATTGRKGPVLIDIPKDVAQGKTKGITKPVHLPSYQPTIKGSMRQLKKAETMIAAAKKPLIFAGGGVVAGNAQAELAAFANLIDAPVCTSLMGIGSIGTLDRRSLGMIGLHGRIGANLAVSECDLLIAVGCRFDDRVTLNDSDFAANMKIIHIDIDPAEIGKNISANIPIVGDVATVLADLATMAQPQENKAWMEKIDHWRQQWPPKVAATNALMAFQITAELNRLAPKDVIYTTDVGQHQMFAAQNLEVAAGSNFITSGGLGTMGYGIPAALGAKLAAPKRTVIAITGDGSFQMNFNELGTIRDQDVDLKIVLFNNACLGMVRQLQHYYSKGEYFGVDLPHNPHFGLIARAYGFPSFLIEKAADVTPVLEKALVTKGTVLIECKVSKEDMVFPIVLNGQPLKNMIFE